MKTVKTIAFASLVFFGLLIIAFFESHYSRIGTVTEVKGNTIEITDTTDNVWIFEGEKTFAEGTKVKLLMFNNDTEEFIYDDEIIKISEFK